MNLVFTRFLSDGRLSVGCNSDVVNSEEYSPLACILNDAGGQRFLDTLPWLAHGLQLLRSVRTAEVDLAVWAREAWSAEIKKDQVKIYSLYDENVFELLGPEAFEKALVAWIIFLESPTDLVLAWKLEFKL